PPCVSTQFLTWVCSDPALSLSDGAAAAIAATPMTRMTSRVMVTASRSPAVRRLLQNDEGPPAGGPSVRFGDAALPLELERPGAKPVRRREQRAAVVRQDRQVRHVHGGHAGTGGLPDVLGLEPVLELEPLLHDPEVGRRVQDATLLVERDVVDRDVAQVVV